MPPVPCLTWPVFHVGPPHLWAGLLHAISVRRCAMSSRSADLRPSRGYLERLAALNVHTSNLQGPAAKESCSSDAIHVPTLQDPEVDGAAAAVLDFLLADVKRQGALEFALDWLHSLFVAHCLPPGAPSPKRQQPGLEAAELPAGPAAVDGTDGGIAAVGSGVASAASNPAKEGGDTAADSAAAIKAEPEDEPAPMPAVKTEPDGAPPAVIGDAAVGDQVEPTAADESPSVQQQPSALQPAEPSACGANAYESVLLKLLEGLRCSPLPSFPCAPHPIST